MLKKRLLMIAAAAIVKILRGLFRLPNGLLAPIFFCLYKLAGLLNMPPEATSDIGDAYQAMRDGPPKSDSLRGVILKSDPVMVKDFVFHAMLGDPPLKDMDSW